MSEKLWRVGGRADVTLYVRAVNEEDAIHKAQTGEEESVEIGEVEAYGDEALLVEDRTVTISAEEYESLVTARDLLDCLEACGVDNWEGYSDAREMLREAGE